VYDEADYCNGGCFTVRLGQDCGDTVGVRLHRKCGVAEIDSLSLRLVF